MCQCALPTFAAGPTERRLVRDDLFAAHLFIWDKWAEWAESAGTGAAGAPGRDTLAAISEVKRCFDASNRPAAARALTSVLDCRPGAKDEKRLHLQAVFTLTVIGGTDATEGLKKALRNKDLMVTLAGVRGLARQPANAAIESLTSVLEAGRVEHADVVLHALAEIGPGRRGLSVAARLLDDERPAVRARAAEVLQSGGAASKEFAPKVLRAIDKEPEEHRAAFIECLAWIAPDAQATKGVLKRYLSSRSSWVRKAAVNGVGWLEVPKLDLEDVVGNAALHDDDQIVRTYAIVALGGFRSPSARTVEILIRYLDDKDDDAVRASIDSLGNLRAAGRQALPKLTHILRNTRFWWIKECAAEAIGKIGDPPPDAQDALVRTLADHDAAVRQAAATALGSVGKAADGTLSALKCSMRDPNPAVVVAGALAAWRIDRNSEAAIVVLLSVINAAGKDEDPVCSALDALAAMGPNARSVCPIAARCLTNDSERVRISALKFLGAAANPKFNSAVKGCLNDPRPRVREAALEANKLLGGGER